jgi:hypothetical protein
MIEPSRADSEVILSGGVKADGVIHVVAHSRCVVGSEYLMCSTKQKMVYCTGIVVTSSNVRLPARWKCRIQRMIEEA